MGLPWFTWKLEENEPLETGSERVSLGRTAAAHCSPGCKSPWDPQSLGGDKRFMPEKDQASQERARHSPGKYSTASPGREAAGSQRVSDLNLLFLGYGLEAE